MKSGELVMGEYRQLADGRLWEPGYRERYYQSKFGASAADAEFTKT